MKDDYIRIRITVEKKEEFQKAVKKKDPNLNMTIVILNFIDEYIKKEGE